MQNLLGPFGDEAVAAFITAIISAIVAYWLHQRSIQRPNIILCEQLSHVDLIRYGLAEILPFSYGDVVIQNPELVRLSLRNMGSTFIKQPSITFEVNQSVKMLKPRFQIIPEREIEFADLVQESPHSVTITLDYLNPEQPHKEVALIDLICDGKIESIKVLGSGEGWSVQYRTLSAAFRIAYTFAITGFLILVVTTIILIAALISGISTDPTVPQALISLWNNSSIRLATLVFVVSIVFVAILARWAEQKSGIPFYKQAFYRIPSSMMRTAINVIFKKRLRP